MSLTALVVIIAGLAAVAGAGWYFWQKRSKEAGNIKAQSSDLSSESQLANEEEPRPVYRPRPERTVALGNYIEPKKQKSKRATSVNTNRVAIARKDCPIFVFAPPGSGKTVSVVIPAMLDWDGPVLATSVKYDLAKDTWKGRNLLGTAHIFDPGEELLQNPDEELTPLRRRWTPLAKCATMRDSMDIAAALVAGGSQSDNSGGDMEFWQGLATSVIGVLLWYTRLKPGSTLQDVNKLVSSLGSDVETVVDDQGRPKDLKGWDVVEQNIEARRAKFARLLEVTDDAEKIAAAEDALEEAEAALAEWSPLVGVAHSAQQTIGSVLAQVTAALRAVRSARELRNTAWDDPELLNLEEFVLSNDTIYVVSPQRTGLFASIMTAFTQSVIDTAYETADRYDSKRLPTELLCALDEVPSISPMPRLPNYTATARSYGIQLLCIAQSVVQTQERWGEKAAGALLSNSSGGFVLLPGALDLETLEWFSKLFGETRIAERSHSTSTTRGSSWGGGQKATHNESTSESTSTSYTWRATASPGKLRALHPNEMAVIMGAQAFQAIQRRWFEDPDLKATAGGDAEAKQRLRTKYKYVTFDQ